MASVSDVLPHLWHVSRPLSNLLFRNRKHFTRPDEFQACCAQREKLFPIDKRFGEYNVQLFFNDNDLAELFSTEELLDRRYGPVLSKQIKLRLALLKAATHLAMVPTKPPFSLRRDGLGGFALDVAPRQLLRLTAEKSTRADLSTVKSVVILGLERMSAAKEK